MLEHDGAEALVRQGQEAGFLTTEEISLALDELGLEPGEVDDFYSALEELQIEVVDEPNGAGGMPTSTSTTASARSRPTRSSSSSRTSERCRS